MYISKGNSFFGLKSSTKNMVSDFPSRLKIWKLAHRDVHGLPVSGPMVRIAPDEVHILDADLWETLFSKAGRVDKYNWMSNRFGNDTSVLTTAAHDLHRVRRNALNPYFSRQRILGLQDTIRQKLSVFVNQIRENANAGAPITISRGYMAFSEDVIMHYCFGYDYDSLRKFAWTPVLHDAFAAVCIAGNMALQFPTIPKVMNALPQAWVEKLDPLYALIFRMQNVILSPSLQIRC
jgi:cytochrome P450